MTDNDQKWATLLLGGNHGARLETSFNRLIPSNPRCKLCAVPFGGLGGTIFGLFGRHPWKKNPTLCNVCQIYAEKHPGGAEVEIALLFADVRGSTSLAETMTPTAFKRMLDTFYATASDVLIGHHAWIDKFVGDEVVAFFFPNGFPKRHHAEVALTAARDLLRVTGGEGLPIGIGVHAGRAYVGTVGGDHVSDVTAVGDDVNIAARLAAAAEAHTIFVSESAWSAAGVSDDGTESREVELKGKSARLKVRVLKGEAYPTELVSQRAVGV